MLSSDETAPWSRGLLENLMFGSSLYALYGTWMFIAVFTRACDMFQIWTKWIQSTKSPPILFVLSLFFLCPGIPSGLLPTDFVSDAQFALFVSTISCYMTCWFHTLVVIILVLFLKTINCEASYNAILCTSSYFLGSDILCSLVISNILQFF